MQARDAALSTPAIAQTLANNLRAVREMLRGLSAEALRWKLEPGRWSLLECLHHLLDEECLDFRARLRLTLEDPDQEWPGIAPESWVLTRAYNMQDPERVMAEFEHERQSSIDWLARLGALDLDRSHLHPQLGELRVGDLLASWLAHDLLHLGQLTRQRIAWLKHAAAPYSSAYAGA